MNLRTPVKVFLISALALPLAVYSQTSNDSSFLFNDLTAFQSPSKNWSVVGDVIIHPDKPADFKKASGTGILLAEADKTESYLTTQASYGDIEMEFDFLLNKGTTAAVLLQERYRLNLSDSWAETNPSFASMGGIGQQNVQGSAAFSGAIPLISIAKAPGLWQHVRLRFRAPQFSNGRKTMNALLEEVYINGVLVQQNMELSGPSVGSSLPGEENSGPVMFYGGNGALALKNLKIRRLAPATIPARPLGRRFNRVVNPIVITPEGSNYLLRSFLDFNRKKKTHVISVGSPKEVNYSYDMKQGTLLQIWNGPFVDVTDMWHERGEPQLAKPLGSVIPLSENPSLAVLATQNAAWPDSIGFDNFKNLGYTLDKQRNPSFEYETGGYHVWDKISFGNEGRRLIRQINVTNAPANLYCRIANASVINAIGKGLYVIGDKTYYIQIDEKLNPSVRQMPRGAELIVPVTENKQISYSLIW